ncbi:MAG: HAD family phosphatase [Planctomycetota bacterium]|nr:HAD family phosphatase [Planctomycetota bacterium]
MTRALLLDLDGTLVDSIPCWIDAYRETLASFGRPLGHAEFLATIYQRSASVRTVLESLQVGVSEAEFRRVRDGRYLEYLGSRVAWLPGAEAFLADAARPLGIVTNSWRAYVDAIDRHLGVRSRVDTLVDLEDAGDRPKPDGHPLELAAERLGAEAARCIYVGDQAHDMAAARAAGMEAWLLQRPETPEAAVGLADVVLADLPALAAAWAADA